LARLGTGRTWFRELHDEPRKSPQTENERSTAARRARGVPQSVAGSWQMPRTAMPFDSSAPCSYDDTKSAADNIDLLPTILSRFDLVSS
jgi:hypothetical protein